LVDSFECIDDLEKPAATIFTSALKMETGGSSKMSLPLYLITQYHILEVCNLNSHCHENLTTQANYKQN